MMLQQAAAVRLQIAIKEGWPGERAGGTHHTPAVPGACRRHCLALVHPACGGVEMASSGRMEDYSLLRCIGKGSFGKVYLVRHKRERKHYCMKVIKLKGIPRKEREATRNEVMLLQKLMHPNIVAYKDSFFARGRDQLCIAMTYCDGGDLEQRVTARRRKLWKEDQILHYFVQVRAVLWLCVPCASQCRQCLCVCGSACASPCVLCFDPLTVYPPVCLCACLSMCAWCVGVVGCGCGYFACRLPLASTTCTKTRCCIATSRHRTSSCLAMAALCWVIWVSRRCVGVWVCGCVCPAIHEWRVPC